MGFLSCVWLWREGRLSAVQGPEMSKKFTAVFLLLKNWLRSRSSRRFSTSTQGEYTFRTFQPSDVSGIDRLCQEVGRGNLPRYDRLLLKLSGPRMCIVATKDGQVIGFDHFYFNDRDLKENTVHEGYVAVSNSHAGRGIASHMRRLSAEHFKRCGFSGISTRISHNNYASMASARKCGFISVEDYSDPGTNEIRSYLIHKLTKIRDNQET